MKNSIMLKITTYPKLIMFFFGLCLFASCSDKEALAPTDSAKDVKSKSKSARTVYFGGSYANYGFNPSGYVTGVIDRYNPGTNILGGKFRETAFIQNYSSQPITVEIFSQTSQQQSNISYNTGSITQSISGSVPQSNGYGGYKFQWTVPANTYYAWISFDHHIAGVESYSIINAVAPISTNDSDNGNTRVYPVGYFN